MREFKIGERFIIEAKEVFANKCRDCVMFDILCDHVACQPRECWDNKSIIFVEVKE